MQNIWYHKYPNTCLAYFLIWKTKAIIAFNCSHLLSKQKPSSFSCNSIGKQICPAGQKPIFMQSKESLFKATEFHYKISSNPTMLMNNTCQQPCCKVQSIWPSAAIWHLEGLQHLLADICLWVICQDEWCRLRQIAFHQVFAGILCAFELELLFCLVQFL